MADLVLFYRLFYWLILLPTFLKRFLRYVYFARGSDAACQRHYQLSPIFLFFCHCDTKEKVKSNWIYFITLQIFFLVITFAQFNGLFVLPIALSHFGPQNNLLIEEELDTMKDDAELKTAMIEPTVTIANAWKLQIVPLPFCE